VLSLLRRAAELAVTPPACLFLLALVGWLVRKKRARLGTALMIGAVAAAYVLSTSFCAAVLMRGLQTTEPLDPGEIPDGPQAIVVLGAGMYPFAPELGKPGVGPLTLERLRQGARLARASGLPLLVSGGSPRAGLPSVASAMAESLEEDFGAPARWQEGASHTTAENARRSARLLHPEGVRHVILVTHSWHMPRSLAAFERAGFEVLPAPTAYRGPPELRLRSFLPSAPGLSQTQLAWHEWVGRAWYALIGAGG